MVRVRGMWSGRVREWCWSHLDEEGEVVGLVAQRVHERVQQEAQAPMVDQHDSSRDG